MSTLFRRFAFVALALAACGRAGEPPRSPAPAQPADHDSTLFGAGRQWTTVTIEGSYGSFEMALPVIRIAATNEQAAALIVDTIALRHVEQRLLSRMARIARAEAAALLRDTTPTMMSTRNPAPEIKPGLLGAIPFNADAIEPSPVGAERVKAVAALAAQLPGRLQIVAIANGTGSAIVDVALARARRTYLDLVANDPRLAEREVLLTIRSVAMLPGAPLPQPVVEVYVSPQ